MTKIEYRETEHDRQTGYRSWNVVLVEDAEQLLGTLEKNTAWCGDGYRADSYDVTLDIGDDDDSIEESFEVGNVWNGGGESARTQLAAARAWIREQCAARGLL